MMMLQMLFIPLVPKVKSQRSYENVMKTVWLWQKRIICVLLHFHAYQLEFMDTRKDQQPK